MYPRKSGAAPRNEGEMTVVRTFMKPLALAAIMFVLAVSAMAQSTGPTVIDQLPKQTQAPPDSTEKAFKCGDRVRPGLSYKQLAICYEQQLKTDASAKDSFISMAQALQQEWDRYDKSQADSRQALADAEKACDANDAKRVADYNALVADYNNLLMAAKVMALSAPSGSPARLWNTLAPPVDTPPRRLYCNTVYGATLCYE